MERQEFEESWKDAFKQAEIGPSESVWTNVELELEKVKGVKLQRRLVFFQLLTAASLLFAIGLGIGIYLLSEDVSQAPAQVAVEQSAGTKNKDINSKVSPSQTEKDIRASDQPDKNLKQPSDFNPTQVIDRQTENNNARTSVNNSSLVVSAEKSDQEFTSVVLKGAELPAIVEIRKDGIQFLKPQDFIDPVAVMLARLDRREQEVRGREERRKGSKKEKLWTAVGFAAGAFNSVNSGVSQNTASNIAAFSSETNGDLATKATIANQQAKAPGTAYTVGLGIGTNLSKRWVLQGGVNYLSQSSDFTAQNAVTSADFTSFRPASINELNKLVEGDVPAENKLVTTAPYNVNNNIRYLSIPIQAGYLIINRAFGLQLNAGIATDLFLQNTIVADSKNLDKSTKQMGEDSPYRSVNLNGLVGTELSYKFGQHYRVAINPGVRYPFNTIYKSELGVEATPLTFDLGLRVRYIFN